MSRVNGAPSLRPQWKADELDRLQIGDTPSAEVFRGAAESANYLLARGVTAVPHFRVQGFDNTDGFGEVEFNFAYRSNGISNRRLWTISLEGDGEIDVSFLSGSNTLYMSTDVEISFGGYDRWNQYQNTFSLIESFTASAGIHTPRIRFTNPDKIQFIYSINCIELPNPYVGANLAKPGDVDTDRPILRSAGGVVNAATVATTTHASHKGSMFVGAVPVDSNTTPDSIINKLGTSGYKSSADPAFILASEFRGRSSSYSRVGISFYAKITNATTTTVTQSTVGGDAQTYSLAGDGTLKWYHFDGVDFVPQDEWDAADPGYGKVGTSGANWDDGQYWTWNNTADTSMVSLCVYEFPENTL